MYTEVEAFNLKVNDKSSVKMMQQSIRIYEIHFYLLRDFFDERGDLMKKNWILSLLTVISVFYFTGQLTHSQDNLYTFNIHVDVSSYDKNAKNLVESYVKKELRKFQDVQIVNFDDSDLVLPAYLLGLVILVEPKTGDIAVACGLHELFDMSIIKPFIRQGKHLDVLLATSGLSYAHYMNVFTGNTNDLSGFCKTIIANVNTEALEPIRKTDQILKR